MNRQSNVERVVFTRIDMGRNERVDIRWRCNDCWRLFRVIGQAEEHRCGSKAHAWDIKSSEFISRFHLRSED
jgi:hypothetical protein